jgi:hypothetical protein
MKRTSRESRSLMPLLLMAASVMAQAVTMQAQTVNWYAVSAPSGREDMAMVYDSATHSTLLFGGCCNLTETLGDTWIFDVGWRQVLPSSSPSARMGAAMTYDEAAGNVVLFGGCSSTDASCTFLNDTWTWNGTTWTQQFPPVSPSPRVTSIAYDAATQTSVLFGGGGSAGALADTWTGTG